jgi:hypothetical protein
MHRPCDILDLLFAHVLEGEVELIPHLIVHHPTDANAPGSASASSRAAILTPSP